MPIAVRPPRWLGTGVRFAAPRLTIVATLAATAALGVFAHEHLRDRGTIRLGDEAYDAIVRARRPVIEPGCRPPVPFELVYLDGTRARN
jgi:hypothetical protein